MSNAIKTCVFCGELPATKTKEHVIPQWLMRLTGDPKRVASFSSIGEDGKNPRAFAFNAFHFPACDSCNNDWAGLEVRAKAVVEKILRSASINATEWNTILDWLDKVRVGIWLGMRMLNKNFLGISPKFHIGQRVSTKDRTVAVVKAKTGQRLTFFGTNTLAFNYMPSCFGITINDTTLLSISYEYLVSERLGFPYPIEYDQHLDGNAAVKMTDGRGLITPPPLNLHLTACGIAIHQVIYKNWEDSHDSMLWQTDYVKKYSLDPASGLSIPFLESEDGQVTALKNTGSREWVPKYKFETNALAGQYLANFCLDIQSMLWKKWADRIEVGEEKETALKYAEAIRDNLEGFRKHIGMMT